MLEIASKGRSSVAPVVLHADLDPVGEAALRHALARELGLGLRERDADDTDPMALGRVDGEAAPAAAHVEHALALLQVQLGADQLELRLLRLLERLGAAREDRAAVGHRLAEEQREELVGHVVVVAHRARVALRRVAAAAQAQLRPRDVRRAPNAERAGGGEGEPCLLPPLERRRLPLGQRLEHRVEIVHVERARDVGAAEPELARRQQRVGQRVRRAHLEGGPAAVGRRQCGAVPEPHRERALGQRVLQLSKKGLRPGQHFRDGTGPTRRRAPSPGGVPGALCGCRPAG